MANDHASPISMATTIRFYDDIPDKIDVAIIGAGVIGIFTALYLAKAGKKVIVLEKGRVAGEQSSRNWGWIRKQGRDRAELPIMIEANRLWHEVNSETNGACGIIKAPVNYLAKSHDKATAHHDWVAVAKDYDVDSRLLSKSEIADIFDGSASENWITGVTTPSDAKGEPWAAVPAVAKLAQHHGALVRENCAVRALDISGGRITGIITEDGTIACEQVVAAGGAWSSLLLRQHGIDLPQLSVRGTVAQTSGMVPFTNQTSLDEELALRPRADGGYTLATTDTYEVYIGPDLISHIPQYLPALKKTWRKNKLFWPGPQKFPDSFGQARKWSADDITPFEHTRVLDPKPNESCLRQIKERFKRKFPKIGQPEINFAWAGMIDALPDFIPVVDRAENIPGLIIATGMSGHGFGIGPGFGKIISRMAMGLEAEHDLTRFRLQRFSDGSKLQLGPSL